MLPVEERIAEVLVDERPDGYLRLAHRGYPIVHDRDAFWFAATSARERVNGRVTVALELADGVAFDGFGYRNHYACFCDRCRDRRPSGAPAAVARDAQDVLVDLSAHLYEHAKDIDPDAVVANHVWPPFRPNPQYCRLLHLDYRSDTVAWFYPPHRSLEEVAFAIQRGRDTERPERNRFVPFVGVYPDPELTRPPARVADELRIATEQCEDVVFATLEAAVERPALGEAIRSVLAE